MGRTLNGGIITDIIKEMESAESKHGKLPYNIDRVNTILMEEVGEMAEASLDFSRGCKNPDNDMAELNRLRLCLRAEWVQIAAVAVRAIENIDAEVPR